ncbi:MAG: hypothetical protein AAF989_02235 [Planctomycetota bacterium]
MSQNEENDPPISDVRFDHGHAPASLRTLVQGEDFEGLAVDEGADHFPDAESVLPELSHAVPDVSSARDRSAAWGSSANEHSSTAQESRAHEGVHRDQWLRLHACDLIGRLQEWTDRLDERESSLNIREAQLDQLQRRQRLSKQQVAEEIDSQKRELRRLRAQVATETRRAAFAQRLPR